MPASSRPVAHDVPRRRVPWALVPVVLALLYAAVSGFLSHRPSLAAMVPSDAFVTWRFNDLAAYDHARTAGSLPTEAPVAPASGVLGAELNLPGLPGVDRGRPLLETWLDPTRRVDPKIFVLPVSDRGALLKTYRDPDLQERHARYVEVHGDWAAAGWDARAVRTAGRGDGLLPASLGEDWSVIARWKPLVDYAVQPAVAAEAPYRGILRALGFKGEGAADAPEKGEPGVVAALKAGRVGFVRDAWDEVSLHSFPGRVRVELVPSSETDLDEALAAAFASKETDTWISLASPEKAQALLSFPSTAASRRAVVLALWYAGLAWPENAMKRGFEALHLDAPGPLLAWAEESPGLLPHWTLAVTAPPSALPDLAAFGLPAPVLGSDVTLPAGLATLAAPYTGDPPAGVVARRKKAGADLEVIAVGVAAETLAAREAGSTAVGDAAPPPPEASLKRLARFSLAAFPAQRMLGSALEPKGLFATLAGSALEGDILTDGRRVIVDVRKAAR